MKRPFKYIACMIGAASFAYLLVMFFVTSQMGSSSIETWEKMKEEPFSCPPGTEVTYRGWSENGTERYCEPVKNGPWEAWMSGYKHVEGFYANGEKVGNWRWFDKNGNVTKEIEYTNNNKDGAAK